MKIILKCVCGAEVTCTTDPRYTKEGDVSIIVDKCKTCDEKAYHEGLVRGSQLKTPLQLDGESMEAYGRRLCETEKGGANVKKAKTQRAKRDC